MQLTKIFVVIERPYPHVEAEILGSTNDQDYAYQVVNALRSLETEATYWIEAVDFLMV